MLGRLLGDRYRVMSLLGEGGMGTVYLCEHAVLRRRFAVKVLRSDAACDPELIERFRNEAIAASRIGQENVVDVIDFGAEEDGALYYVMEALDGRSLGAVIREEGRLPVLRTLDVLEQLCRALAAAHGRGVVHRDVKPDNVFLVRREDGSEQAKVIDFGISHVPPAHGTARTTRAGDLIGTPEYMAPEQASGREVDGRTDVYAAGVCAFEMLTGALPIEADSAIATLVAHQTRTPDAPSRRAAGIPPEVDALVLRALAKRPEERFPSMEAFAAEVARVRARLGYATPAERRAGGSAAGKTLSLFAAAARVRRATGRRAARAAVLALTAALAAAAVAWWALPLAGPRLAGSPSVVAEPPRAGPPAAALDPPALAPAPATLVEEQDSPLPPAAAPVALEPPKRPARSAARRAAPPPDPAAELHDPYSAGGELKDPFE